MLGSHSRYIGIMRATSWVPAAIVVGGAGLSAGCPGFPFVNQPLPGETAAILPSPDRPAGPREYLVDYRFGKDWDSADNKLETNDRTRYLFLKIQGSKGNWGGDPPTVEASAPAGSDFPQVDSVSRDDTTGYFTSRVRFYAAGTGYKLRVKLGDPKAPLQTDILDLPPVELSRRIAGDRALTFLADPPIGSPFVPVKFTLQGYDLAGQPATSSGPVRMRMTNPCGWGPEATFSADPASLGRYTATIPADDIIEVTGNYRVKIFPLSDGTTSVDFAYQTK